MNTKHKDRAEDQARSQLSSVVEMADRLKHCQECDGNDCQRGANGGDTWANAEEYHDEETARQAISEDALAVEIVKTYKILLCTGGPAARIVGELNEYNEATTARLEHQDWGTPWTVLETTPDEKDSLLAYVRQFYFGEATGATH